MNRRAGRRDALLLGVPLVVLSVAGLVAAALTPLLVREHPLLLIVLEARNRYLLLVNARVDVVPFVAVALVRRFASDPFYFLAGRWYGERATEWATRTLLRSPAAAARAQSLFRRCSWLLVLAFPGALVSVLAGAAGMSLRRFALLNLTGTLAVVLALRLAGDALAAPLAVVTAWTDANATWLTAVAVAVLLVWVLARRDRSAELRLLRALRGERSGENDRADQA